MNRTPTMDIVYEGKRVIEYRYTPFRCSDAACYFSPNSVGIYMLNPFDKKPSCPNCGKEMIYDNHMKELIDRHEFKI